jgi:hypothetical protein
LTPSNPVYSKVHCCYTIATLLSHYCYTPSTFSTPMYSNVTP